MMNGFNFIKLIAGNRTDGLELLNENQTTFDEYSCGLNCKL